MSNEFKPTEKMQELRQTLKTLPVSSRKPALAAGKELAQMKRNLAELKREREEMQRKTYLTQDDRDLALSDSNKPPEFGTWSPPASYLVNTPPSLNPAKPEK